MGKLPDFFFEKRYWNKGYRVIAGVDEVGRGSLAGPVVAGVVAFDKSVKIAVKIDDSKKLSAKNREKAGYWIKRNALCYGIGKASVSQINKFGIKKATEIAFRKAIKNCGRRVEFLLIDAFFVPHVKGLRRRNQHPIINGDEKSLSIAAASIIAKVYRDKIMAGMEDKIYGWGKNKGYGTKAHQKAIKKFGVSKFHRKLFVRKLVSSQARLSGQSGI